MCCFELFMALNISFYWTLSRYMMTNTFINLTKRNSCVLLLLFVCI